MTDQLIRLNHAELQLLELVEEYGAWITGIQTGDSWGSNNKWNYQYAADQWAEALERLRQLNLIALYPDEVKGKNLPGNPPNTRAEFLEELLRTDITFDALDTRPATRAIWLYRLTAEGGRVWEQFVRPNWDRYLRWGSLLDEDNPSGDKCGEVSAATPELAKAFLELAHHLGQKINPGTLQWSEERPWDIRSWKQLPVCHKVNYQFKEDTGDPWHKWNRMPLELWQLLYGWRRQRISP